MNSAFPALLMACTGHSIQMALSLAIAESHMTQLRQTCLIPMLLLLIPGCGMPGQRLLTIEIHENDELRFRGIRGVPDDTPFDEMWDYLNSVRFAPQAEDEDAAQKSVRPELKGSVRVIIFHGESQLATSQVNSLTLTRNDSGGWQISPAALKQIKGAAH